MCCTVKDSGVAAIEDLMARKGGFDYILLETTGLADPGNIAPLFWLDEALKSQIYLDGVVTLVDAKNVVKCLDEPKMGEKVDVKEEEEEEDHGHKGPEMTTAHLQISHADVVVVNKSDLVTPEELEAVKDRVRSINGLARIHVTNHSQVPQLEGVLLNLHAYDGVDEIDFAAKGHSHLDPTISTITLSMPLLNEVQVDKLDAWLQSVCWESQLPGVADAAAFEIHRIKGRIPLVSGQIRLLQGVREIFELTDAAHAPGDASASTKQSGKIVVIGRGLDVTPWQQSLDMSLL